MAEVISEYDLPRLGDGTPYRQGGQVHDSTNGDVGVVRWITALPDSDELHAVVTWDSGRRGKPVPLSTLWTGEVSE